MNILALDPASVTGWFHSNGRYGVWILTGSKLVQLREHLEDALQTLGIDKLTFEEAGFGAGARQRRTMQFHNELRGVIRLFAQEHRIPTVAYVPSTIKKFATGNGRAKKPQMIRAAETFFGLKGITSDVADAKFILEMAKANYQPMPSPKKRKRAAVKAAKKDPRLF